MLQNLKINISKFIRSLKYLIRFYLPVKQILKSNQVNRVYPFKFLDWHHGFMYFIANYDSKKVFVKVDTQHNLVENEIKARQIISKDLYFLEVVDFFRNNQISMVLFPYVNFETLNEIDSVSDKVGYMNQCFNLISRFNQYGLIHRDIKFDNIIVYKGKLYLNDFVFVKKIITDEYHHIKFNQISDDNTNFKKDVGIYKQSENIWNDFYSLLMMISSLNTQNFSKKQLKKLDGLKMKITEMINEKTNSR